MFYKPPALSVTLGASAEMRDNPGGLPDIARRAFHCFRAS
jgi:hypothetical protein